MHEWFAVITILSFLLLLIGVTCKSRFEEREAIVTEMLDNRSKSKGLANVQVVTKKRRISSKTTRKTSTKHPRKRMQKAN
jgi:hypothetical protein